MCVCDIYVYVAGAFRYQAASNSHHCCSFSGCFLSLSLFLFFSLGASVDTCCLRHPSASILVFLVLSKLYPYLPPHCHSSLRLLCPMFLQLFFLCSDLLVRLSLAVLVSALCFGTKPIVRYIPLASVSAILPCLPSCSSQLVSFSSLYYHASFRVSSIWDGEESVSPLPFFSLLVPLVFPSASLFLSLFLFFSLGAFGAQDSLCLPCVPLCVLIEPIFSYLLLLAVSV